MFDPQPESLAGRYRLDRPLGRGGMGEVWAGHDVRLRRPVAVKILRPDLARDVEARQRFEAEATAAAQLVDPHVVAIFDTGEDEGVPYIVMELLSGETLRDVLDRGPVDPARARAVADQVLAALTVAHGAGIVHRDIKPGNVLRAGPDAWKLADFGIAKSLEATADLTMTGLVPGTPAYLAPERLAGRPASPAADLYSVGVVLYEALSGRRPFAADSPIATVHAIQTVAPVPLDQIAPGVDPALVAVVTRAMRRDPRRRFASAAAMRAALDPRATSGRTRPVEAVTEPIHPPSGTRTTRGATRTLAPRAAPTRRPATRSHGARWRWVAVAFGVVVLAAVAVGLAAQRNSSSPGTSNSTATTATSPVTAIAGPTGTLPTPLADALQRLDQQVQP